MSKTTIPTGGITADAINGTLIADDAIDSEHYTDGSIDTAHIGDSQVTSAKTSGVGGANTPAFLARLSSTTQSISNDTYTKIQFNTEVYDTANAYDNSSNYRFTVPSGQGGKYFIYSAVRMASSSATLTLNLRLNGSNAGFSSLKAVSGELQTIILNFSKDLSADDYIEIYLRQQSGGSLNASGDSNDQTTYFGAFKIIE